MRSGSISAGYFPHPMRCLLHNTIPPQKKHLSCFFAQHLTSYWPLGRASRAQLSIISGTRQSWSQWGVKGGKTLYFPPQQGRDPSPWEEGAANTVAHSKGRWVSTALRKRPVWCHLRQKRTVPSVQLKLIVFLPLPSTNSLENYQNILQPAVNSILLAETGLACQGLHRNPMKAHVTCRAQTEHLRVWITEPDLSQDQEHTLVILASPKIITHTEPPMICNHITR